MTDHSPVFKSAKAQARMLAVYDKAMKLWPIPYEQRDIPTQYVSTHVIISGPENAPPLVLLHCALMTSAIWSPIIEDLSRDHRTYAVDVIGDVGRTVPSNPPATERDLASWLDEVFEGLSIDEASILAWSSRYTRSTTCCSRGTCSTRPSRAVADWSSWWACAKPLPWQ